MRVGDQRLDVPPIPRGIRILMAINGVVFLVNMLAVGRLTTLLGLTWRGLSEYYGLGVLRFVTYQFTHSYGSPGHLLWNMLSLWMLGGIVEEFVRTKRTIQIYLWCGFAGGIGQLLLAALFGIDVPMVGASGACFGLMVYATCLAPNRLFFGFLPLWVVTAISCFLALYNVQLDFLHGAGSAVADGAHLGGAAWGAVCWKLDRTRTFLDTWRDGFLRWKQGRNRARDEQREASLDQVLSKVKQQGLSSLTSSERRVLDRASKELRGR